MRVFPKNEVKQIKKHQMGGAMTAPADDPIMQLAAMADEALKTQNCEAAMAVCDAFLQLIAQVEGGAAPTQEPMPVEEGEPVYKKGGKLARRIR